MLQLERLILDLQKRAAPRIEEFAAARAVVPLRAVVVLDVVRRGVTVAPLVAVGCVVTDARETVARALAARDAPVLTVVRAVDALRVVVPRDVTVRVGATDCAPDAATARDAVRPVVLRGLVTTGKTGFGETCSSTFSSTIASSALPISISEYSIVSS